MRVLGVVLVLLGSLLLGFVWQRGQKRRIACLAGLSAALTRLEAELAGKNASLPVIALILAEEANGAEGAFFSALSQKLSALGERSFRELWCEATEAELPALTTMEKSAMRELGGALGRYPMEMQLASLSRCRSLFEEHLARARTTLPNDARLVWGLAASSGLLLLIVLL